MSSASSPAAAHQGFERSAAHRTQRRQNGQSPLILLAEIGGRHKSRGPLQIRRQPFGCAGLPASRAVLHNGCDCNRRCRPYRALQFRCGIISNWAGTDEQTHRAAPQHAGLMRAIRTSADQLRTAASRISSISAPSHRVSRGMATALGNLRNSDASGLSQRSTTSPLSSLPGRHREEWLSPSTSASELLPHAEDLQGLEHLEYAAGLPPYLRGPYSTMYVIGPWTIRQYAGFSTPKNPNAFYPATSRRTARPLVAFDLASIAATTPTTSASPATWARPASPSIHPRHEAPLRPDPLDQMSVSMTMNGAVLPIMAFL